MGDELGGPTTTGRAAEPGLDAWLQRTRGEVGVVVAVAGRGALERGSEAAGFVAEHRFEDHAGAVVEFADHLVAGDERERHPVLEVERCMTLDEREVGSADAGKPGVHAMPARTGQFGLVDRGELERSELRGGDRRDGRGDTRHAELAHRPRDLQRLHATTRAASTFALQNGWTGPSEMTRKRW